MNSWIVMIRSDLLRDSMIARIWAADENKAREVVAVLHPGYTIRSMRAE